ncbi:MAG: hypothetical protein V1806_02160 [Pseudomonadota bacterium]
MAGDDQDYQRWIERQRRYRLKALAQSPEARLRGGLRLCAACGEVCLCHEADCPNCGGADIAWGDLAGGLAAAAGRIRCRLRFAGLKDHPGE